MATDKETKQEEWQDEQIDFYNREYEEIEKDKSSAK